MKERLLSTIKDQFEKPLTYNSGTRIKDEMKLLVNSIKAMITAIYNGDFHFEKNFSLVNHIRQQLPIEYSKAEEWFIGLQGKSIAKYAMEVRVNKVKELLVYTDMCPESIAVKLNYSSANKLSEELIQLTGLPVAFFKKQKEQKTNLVTLQQLKIPVTNSPV